MTATFPCNLPMVRCLFVLCRMALSPVMETWGRAASPLRVLHEAPCHLIPRLVEGADALDEFRGPAASPTGRGDHAVADIGVDTAHQECADRAEMPALVLDGCAIGFTFAELSCRERACKADLDDADVLAFVADPMIAVGRWR